MAKIRLNIKGNIISCIILKKLLSLPNIDIYNGGILELTITLDTNGDEEQYTKDDVDRDSTGSN